MKKYWETEEFERVNAEWRQKLKSSGFKDIEKANGDYTKEIKRKDEFTTSMNANYWTMATNYLHNGQFDSEDERTIWEMHCEGASLNTIAKHLGTSNWMPRVVIAKIKNKAGLK